MVTLDLRVQLGPAPDVGNPWGLGAGEARPLADVWSGARRTDDPEFAGFLTDLARAAKGGAVRLTFPPWTEPDVTEPGLWNLIGDRAFAREYPLSWDYLAPDSPNRPLKLFQRRLYLQRVARWLDELPRGAHVLDLGGGIGRFGQAWLERGYATTVADPNDDALALALGHLASLGGRFALHHLAAESLTGLPDAHFHLVSAMEVFCYLSRPESGFAEATRVLRPGGLLIASVESPVGSLDPTAEYDSAAIEAALTQIERSVDGDAWVRYFTPERLREAAESQGLVVEAILGTHYLPDGPMHHLVDFSRLGDPAYEEAIIEFETVLDASPRWRDRARAWVVVARKP